MFRIIQFVLFITICTSIKSQILTVKITNIRSQNGVILLSFFTNNESFQNEIPLFNKIVPKKTLKDGVIKVSFNDIPKGKYGITLLDDENKNSDMDYKFFIPQEGFGFSNYYLDAARKPHIDKFMIDFGEKDLNVEIKVKYMN